MRCASRVHPAFALLALFACNKAQTPAATTPPARPDVVATVNGVPITEAELQLRAQAAMRGPAGHAPPAAQQVLDDIVKDELYAQRALQLGLDRDPRYANKLAAAEAQYTASRRKQLVTIMNRELAEKAGVTDADARKFYDDNAALMRTELHILQIVRKGEAAAQAASAELKSGKPFDEVAGASMPMKPEENQRPWDLGWLNWGQLPPAWRATVPTLPDGGISDPMLSAPNRFTIVQVLGKRENADLGFDKLRGAILEHLRSARVDEIRQRAEQEMRQQAKVVQVKAPAITDVPRAGGEEP